MNFKLAAVVGLLCGAMSVAASSDTGALSYAIYPTLDHDGDKLAFVTNEPAIVGDAKCGPDGTMTTCQKLAIGRPYAAHLLETAVNQDSAITINWPQLDASGRYLVFTSAGENAPAVYWADLVSHEVTMASIGIGGAPAQPDLKAGDENFGTACAIWCGPPSISQDGLRVAFSSWSPNLIEGDFNERPDVFLRDIQNSRTVLVSVGIDGKPANDASFESGTGRYVSEDGRYVVFTSAASNLLQQPIPFCPASTGRWPYQVSACPQVYLRDTLANTTRLISVDQTGRPGNAMSLSPVISADGSRIAYITSASNILSANSIGKQVVLVDVQKDRFQLVSLNSDGQPSDGEVLWVAMDDAGRRIAFASTSSSLSGQSAGTAQLYVYDESTDQVVRLTTTDGGPPSVVHSFALSGDGRMAAFAASTSATSLAAPPQIVIVDVDSAIPGDRSAPMPIVLVPAALVLALLLRRRQQQHK